MVGGLFLSTHGYTSNAFEHLTELDRERVRFGVREKVLTLCKTYSKRHAGIWSPPECLSEIFHEEVL
jgi:restriction system protein